MKKLKKRGVAQQKESMNEMLKQILFGRQYRRSSSAGMFYTSSAGAVTSLILMQKDN